MTVLDFLGYSTILATLVGIYVFGYRAGIRRSRATDRLRRELPGVEPVAGPDDIPGFPGVGPDWWPSTPPRISEAPTTKRARPETLSTWDEDAS